MAFEDLNKTTQNRSNRILFWALFISLFTHIIALLVCILVMKTGSGKRVAAVKARESALAGEAKKLAEQEKQQPPEPSLTFLDTDPLLSQLPSKPTPYFGAANSRAANAEPIPNSKPVPTIRGEQKQSLQFVERGVPTPLPQMEEPNPLPTSAAKKLTEEPFKPEEKTPAKIMEKPANPEYQDPPTPKNFGDTAKVLAKGSLAPQSQPAPNQNVQTAPKRPRRLSEVRGVSNSKMASEGNAGELGASPSFDVQLTGFGAYDAQLIEAIRQSWYELIDSTKPQGTGMVVISFNLHSDGSISEVQVTKNNSGNGLLETVALGGIRKPAPYAKWPSSMLREIGGSQTQIIITFYYL